MSSAGGAAQRIRYSVGCDRRHAEIIDEARGSAGLSFLLIAKVPQSAEPVKRRCVICDELKDARHFAVSSASCKACR